MKELYIINRGKYARLDDADYDRISQFRWYASERGHITRSVKGNFRTIHTAMANEVLKKYGITIDHIDRNPYNNQRSNLRIATMGQNNFNSSKRKGTSSKYKGVFLFRDKKRWIAAIQCNRKKLYLGLFASEEAAAKAYNKKCLELFKEFGVLNDV